MFSVRTTLPTAVRALLMRSRTTTRRCQGRSRRLHRRARSYSRRISSRSHKRGTAQYYASAFAPSSMNSSSSYAKHKRQAPPPEIATTTSTPKSSWQTSSIHGKHLVFMQVQRVFESHTNFKSGLKAAFLLRKRIRALFPSA